MVQAGGARTDALQGLPRGLDLALRGNTLERRLALNKGNSLWGLAIGGLTQARDSPLGTLTLW